MFRGRDVFRDRCEMWEGGMGQGMGKVWRSHVLSPPSGRWGPRGVWPAVISQPEAFSSCNHAFERETACAIHESCMNLCIGVACMHASYGCTLHLSGSLSFFSPPSNRVVWPCPGGAVSAAFWWCSISFPRRCVHSIWNARDKKEKRSPCVLLHLKHK